MVNVLGFMATTFMVEMPLGSYGTGSQSQETPLKNTLHTAESIFEYLFSKKKVLAYLIRGMISICSTVYYLSRSCLAKSISLSVRMTLKDLW